MSEARGRGIGRRLIESVADAARTAGATRLLLAHRGTPYYGITTELSPEPRFIPLASYATNRTNLAPVED